jgi:hypothetical protein
MWGEAIFDVSSFLCFSYNLYHSIKLVFIQVNGKRLLCIQQRIEALGSSSRSLPTIVVNGSYSKQ